MAQSPFVWGKGGAALTPAQVALLRESADAAAERGVDFSPVGHWSQGLARVVDAFGGYRGKMRAQKEEEEGQARAKAAMDPIVAALMGGYGGAQGPSGMASAPPDPSQAIADDTMMALGHEPLAPAGWDAIRNGIFAGESGGDYNALFGFSNRPGEAFANTKLTDMTVDQALAFADPSGPYAQHVKRQVGRVATPMGAYQVVGTTLKGAKDGLGLTGGERMTPELQDLIGQYIYQTQGTGAWEGYRGPQSGGGGPRGMDPRMMQALMAASQDPWAAQTYGPVINALMEREFAKQSAAEDYAAKVSDPAYLMGLEKAQLELDALRNPQPGFRMTTPEEAQAYGGPGQIGPDGRYYPLADGGDDRPELVRQREELARIAGLQPGTPDYQEFMLTGNTVGRGANEYGLNPLFGTDEAGNVTVMQLGKDGTAVMTKLPEGVTPNLGIRKEEEARGSAVGKQAGEAAADLSGARITADRTIRLVDELYNDPYLESMIGPIEGRLPNITASAGRVQSRMDQLQGTAFLEAYNMLRGGGQITEVEGKKAEGAMARLRTAQSEADYRAALMDFRDAVETGIAKLEARAGTTAFKPQAGGDDLSAEERAYLGVE